MGFNSFAPQREVPDLRSLPIVAHYAGVGFTGRLHFSIYYILGYRFFLVLYVGIAQLVFFLVCLF